MYDMDHVGGSRRSSRPGLPEYATRWKPYETSSLEDPSHNQRGGELVDSAHFRTCTNPREPETRAEVTPTSCNRFVDGDEDSAWKGRGGDRGLHPRMRLHHDAIPRQSRPFWPRIATIDETSSVRFAFTLRRWSTKGVPSNARRGVPERVNRQLEQTSRPGEQVYVTSGAGDGDEPARPVRRWAKHSTRRAGLLASLAQAF